MGDGSSFPFCLPSITAKQEGLFNGRGVLLAFGDEGDMSILRLPIRRTAQPALACEFFMELSDQCQLCGSTC